MFRIVYTLGVRKSLNLSNPINYTPKETTLRLASFGNKECDLITNFKNLSLGNMEEYIENDDDA